jgi:HAD superfamily hydrolase (TIGR01493 family)
MDDIKCIAFDCFGTVFDMSGVDRAEIKAYVEHVRRDDFSPYKFPESWFALKAHPDAAEGIRRLQEAGYFCVAMSNGTVQLINTISTANDIHWNAIIDLILHGTYKPHVKAYRAIEESIGIAPARTLMVTANPTFGDIEGSSAIGMPSQVIRHGYPDNIIELAEMLGPFKR